MLPGCPFLEQLAPYPSPGTVGGIGTFSLGRGGAVMPSEGSTGASALLKDSQRKVMNSFGQLRQANVEIIALRAALARQAG